MLRYIPKSSGPFSLQHINQLKLASKAGVQILHRDALKGSSSSTHNGTGGSECALLALTPTPLVAAVLDRKQERNKGQPVQPRGVKVPRDTCTSIGKPKCPSF